MSNKMKTFAQIMESHNFFAEEETMEVIESMMREAASQAIDYYAKELLFTKDSIIAKAEKIKSELK